MIEMRYCNILQVSIVLFIITLCFYWFTFKKEDYIAYNGDMKFLDTSFTYTSYLPKVENPRKICDGKRVLVVIKSAPENFEKRHVIRENWGNRENTPNDYLTLFIIGIQNDTDTKFELQKEGEDFGDVIHYDLVDSHKNLTMKIHAIYDWYQVICPEAKYLVQLDDNAAIDLRRLDYFVQKEFDHVVEKQNGDGVFCTNPQNSMLQNNVTNLKHILKNSHSHDIYSKYCLSSIIVVTHKTVDKLLTIFKQQNFESITNDLHSGLMHMNINVKLTDPGIFCQNKKQQEDKCRDGPGSIIRIVANCQLEHLQIIPTYKNITQMSCSKYRKYT